MADTPKPMTDEDIIPPPADTSFEAAVPLKDAGVTFESATSDPDTQGESGKAANAKQTLIEGTTKLRDQAGDRARTFAEDGKARATGALGELSQLLNDAAAQVDEKIGEQYGQYARSAAERVQGFSATLDEKSVDELFENARELVRKSPGVAIGAAAAVGFIVARLLTAGLDQRES